MKSTIQSLDVSLLLHATEDCDRVAAAVKGLIAVEAPLETEEMEGHFRNRIIKVSLHLHGEEATRAFAALIARMPADLRKELAADVDKLIDEHSSLFLRLDKQRLIQGVVAAGYEDAVRFKVKPRAFLMHGHAREFFLEQLEAG
jgi:RNA binding exosome subunit